MQLRFKYLNFVSTKVRFFSNQTVTESLLYPFMGDQSLFMSGPDFWMDILYN